MEVDETTGEVIEPDGEPEEPNEEPVEAPEPEPGEEEVPDATEEQAVGFDQMSEGEQSKILDKLDREAERHVKRLQEVLKEDALMLLPCELCNPRTSGWVDLQAITDEVKQRVRIMIGDREPVKREHDRYSRRCEACDGEGEVETGSKITAQATLPCIDCGGKGWIPVGPERLGARPVATVTPIGANGPAATEPAAPTVAVPSPEEQAEIDSLKARGYAVIAPVRPS